MTQALAPGGAGDYVVSASTTADLPGAKVVAGPAVRLRLPGGRSVPASGHDQLRGF